MSQQRGKYHSHGHRRRRHGIGSQGAWMVAATTLALTVNNEPGSGIAEAYLPQLSLSIFTKQGPQQKQDISMATTTTLQMWPFDGPPPGDEPPPNGEYAPPPPFGSYS